MEWNTTTTTKKKKKKTQQNTRTAQAYIASYICGKILNQIQWNAATQRDERLKEAEEEAAAASNERYNNNNINQTSHRILRGRERLVRSGIVITGWRCLLLACRRAPFLSPPTLWESSDLVVVVVWCVWVCAVNRSTDEREPICRHRLRLPPSVAYAITAPSAPTSATHRSELLTNVWVVGNHNRSSLFAPYSDIIPQYTIFFYRVIPYHFFCLYGFVSHCAFDGFARKRARVHRVCYI